MAKEKIVFPSYRRGDKLTKKGTKPNEAKERLVSIKNLETGEISRIPYGIAERKVSTGKWAFCPKRRK